MRVLASSLWILFLVLGFSKSFGQVWPWEKRIKIPWAILEGEWRADMGTNEKSSSIFSIRIVSNLGHRIVYVMELDSRSCSVLGEGYGDELDNEITVDLNNSKRLRIYVVKDSDVIYEPGNNQYKRRSPGDLRENPQGISFVIFEFDYFARRFQSYKINKKTENDCSQKYHFPIVCH